MHAKGTEDGRHDVDSVDERDADKARRIAGLAALGAAEAARLGQDADRVQAFLTHYFRHVDADELLQREPRRLLREVIDHYELAGRRRADVPAVAVRTVEAGDPSAEPMIVQIVTDDQPFLVDSVTMELGRQGWHVGEVFHPQFAVRRDLDGRLTDIVRTAVADSDPSVVRESWMSVGVFPPRSVGRGEPGEQEVADLTAGLRAVLADVSDAVQDWAKMRARARELGDELDVGVPGQPTRAVQVACDLLDWLLDNHFTFLGYREYTVQDAGTDATLVGVPGTGLGILRGDRDPAGSFAAVPSGDGDALVVVAKGNQRATVHRAAYLDYLGIRRFDADGRVVGERRFLGLFSSLAYSESVQRVPLLRDKAAELVARSGYAPSSHGAKAILDVLETYPRDDLFGMSVDELEPIVERIAQLRDRRQVRTFWHRDPYGRFLSVLVYLPRDRYTTDVREVMQEVMRAELGEVTVDYTARVTESVLAQVHFVVRAAEGTQVPQPDTAVIERRFTDATRTWQDRFADALDSARAAQARSTRAVTDEEDGVGTGGETPERARLLELAALLPDGYRAEFTPRQAVQDVTALTRVTGRGDGSDLVIYRPDDPEDEADLRLKVFRTAGSVRLATVLPHLSRLGVEVLDERPYELAPDATGRRAWIYDFGLRVPGGAESVSRWDAATRRRVAEAFEASFGGRAEADALTALVTVAGLTWREVEILRAVSRYLRQTNVPWSQDYIAQALRSNVEVARGLVALFEARFDPDRVETGDEGHEDEGHGDEAVGAEVVGDEVVGDTAEGQDGGAPELTEEAAFAAREEAAAGIVAELTALLDEVASLDHDRIIRAFLAVVQATVRTNAYARTDPDAPLALKLAPQQLPDLPEPRPAFEIFVYSPRLEGVHLRFGPIARGGLRWSDRAEDFRTEILGLVKAQMVKNTVIVPVGAKGGFYAKQLPDPRDRDAWLAEGVACYRLFITALLSVTDNRVDHATVHPERVVRYDADDSYLVVAADKGTASFSDIANEIALAEGFWLGDAFASGGSAGYDHKGMGITARGAWESVIRHFRELGVDCQNEDFTAVGIGDMSGDVFGNGMLRSRHTRLVAAFDHRHIFVDPDPDAARSWTERERLFGLPRSSWADYDTSVISEGGGVFPRSLKTITITEPMRRALGIPASVAHLAPAELISAILTAPVDLLWNGGIGTYVKAASETSADVGDKANDAVRVNGGDLRARCVGEGGNLGFTQRGRIEYALGGGLINTDAIDNSAGVDTSDQEVNIKILLAAETAAGRLDRTARDELLASMTDEVATQVLAHNVSQNLALADAAAQAPDLARVHEDWMEALEAAGHLDRAVEALPRADELSARIDAGGGLTVPELSVLLAWTKIFLADKIIASDLPDDPYLGQRLIEYFPTPLRQRYARQMPQHPLHREIVTTVAVNRFVDSSGITCYHRLSDETGANAADIIRAQLVARALFKAGTFETRIRQLDHQVAAAEQTRLRLEVRTMVERATRWILTTRRGGVDIVQTLDQLGDGVSVLMAELGTLLVGREHRAYTTRLEAAIAAGIPEDLAARTAALPAAYAALPIAQIAVRSRREVVDVARVHFELAQQLGLDRLLARVAELPRSDRWKRQARATLRDDLHKLHARLTSAALDSSLGPRRSATQIVHRWRDRTPGIEQLIGTLEAICAEEPDLARMSVGVRLVRSLAGG